MHTLESPRHADHAHLRSVAVTLKRKGMESFTAQRTSPKERLEAGKQLRKIAPRSAHGKFRAASDRRGPVEILKAQEAGRVPKLIPIRYARMLENPFAFLRGGAAIMAADLSRTPVTGAEVTACGDMHIGNFGLYASAERTLTFAINDFDEVHPGPWEWDLKRVAASAAVAARFLGGDAVDGDEAVRAAVSSYRRHMHRYAEMGFLELWYDRIDERTILEGLPPDVRQAARRMMDRARAKGHRRSLEKLTEEVDGRLRIVEDIPFVFRETHGDDGTPIERALDLMFRSYLRSIADDRRLLLSRYQVVDVARKVVGVGSVGTGCWVVLLTGLDTGDPLFLQVKEALPSVLAPYTRTQLPFTNQGRRVVVGQRLTQGSPDIFLGWGPEEGRHFYVRQLADMKGGVEFVEGERKHLRALREYCRLCGRALALAHAKSGDPATIAGYCGRKDALDEAFARFARAYAAQNDRDYHEIVSAKRHGKIRVAS